MKQNLKSFKNLEDVQLYAREYHLELVVYKNVVYDVSSFYTHSGRYKHIIKYSGKNLTNILRKIPEHQSHLQEVLWKLNSFRFGYMSDRSHSFSPPTRKSKSEIAIIRKFLLYDAQKKVSSTLSQLIPYLVNQEEHIQRLPILTKGRSSFF